MILPTANESGDKLDWGRGKECMQSIWSLDTAQSVIVCTKVSIFVYFPCFSKEVNKNGVIVSTALILSFGEGKTIPNSYNSSSTTSK
jgi:hypothetical protein